VEQLVQPPLAKLRVCLFAEAVLKCDFERREDSEDRGLYANKIIPLPSLAYKKGEGQDPWITPTKIKLNPTTEVAQAIQLLIGKSTKKNPQRAFRLFWRLK